MTTNVPAFTFGSSGFVAPSDAAILSGVFADFQAAFGGGLNASLSTPQGQLASSISAVLGEVGSALLYYFAQVDPAFASGRFQDAIARIYFLARRGALPTAVTCVCTGAAGTIIPVGSLVAAVDGTIYQSEDVATIPSGGSVSVQFEAIVDGPTACPAGSISFIQTVIPGWDSVTNPSDGVPGRYTETRAELETRRGASVALNSVSILQSIRGELLNVDDVIDAYVTENDTGATATIGGVSIEAHSIYVAVAGGSDADVARAIWTKKAPGCSYTGSTTVIIEDTGSGYAIPYPQYSVKFQRPASLPIFFSVQIANGSDVPANATALIKAAIVSAFNGTDGSNRAGIGATVFAGRFYAAVYALGSWVHIVTLKIGVTSPGALDEVTVNIDQIPTIIDTHITVSVV